MSKAAGIIAKAPPGGGDRLTPLRARLRQLEQFAPEQSRHRVAPFGVAAIDRALPARGLALGALHEVLGGGNDEEDATLPAAFAALIVGRLGRSEGFQNPRSSADRQGDGTWLPGELDRDCASFETQAAPAPQDEVFPYCQKLPHPEAAQRPSRRTHDFPAAPARRSGRESSCSFISQLQSPPAGRGQRVAVRGVTDSTGAALPEISDRGGFSLICGSGLPRPALSPRPAGESHLALDRSRSSVIPAQAGIHLAAFSTAVLGSHFRGNDGESENGRAAEAAKDRRDGPVLWCSAQRDLYGPGLAALGLDPGRVVRVSARRDEEVLWAMEEGLRMPGLVAVVGEIGRLPMVASRRLQLAAERSGVTALVLRRWRDGATAAAERHRPSAAVTRWRVATMPAVPGSAGEPGLGRPRWRLELLRCRGGQPGCWEVALAAAGLAMTEVADATGAVSVSAELGDRPPPRRPAPVAPDRRPASRVA